jgi:uncharacterized protein
MAEKVGRNDPCPCGSKKKYKQCCMQKDLAEAPTTVPGRASTILSTKKFTAKVISGGGEEQKKREQAKAAASVEVNLMDRTFGRAIEKAKEAGKPPEPVDPEQYLKDKKH